MKDALPAYRHRRSVIAFLGRGYEEDQWNLPYASACRQCGHVGKGARVNTRGGSIKDICEHSRRRILGQPKRLFGVAEPADIDRPKAVRPMHQFGKSVLLRPIEDERELPRRPTVRIPGDSGRLKFIVRVVGQKTMLRGISNVSANAELVTRFHDAPAELVQLSFRELVFKLPPRFIRGGRSRDFLREMGSSSRREVGPLAIGHELEYPVCHVPRRNRAVDRLIDRANVQVLLQVRQLGHVPFQLFEKLDGELQLEGLLARLDQMGWNLVHGGARGNLVAGRIFRWTNS